MSEAASSFTLFTLALQEGFSMSSLHTQHETQEVRSLGDSVELIWVCQVGELCAGIAVGGADMQLSVHHLHSVTCA